MTEAAETRLHGDPIFQVDRPVMTQQWLDLSAIHWRVDPEIVADQLPAGLEPDIFDDSGWVGLIPFRMVGIAPGTGPAIPYFGTFPETNIRTYVTGPAGPGIWFHSLDIARLVPVFVARTTYRLPYIWSKMAIEIGGNRIAYTALRRWPGGAGTKSRVELAIGDRIEAPSQLEHFLSARWGLYTMLGKRLSFAKVEHEPWPLHAAELLRLEDELAGAAGYGGLGAPEHVMFSPGVSVKIELPRLV